MSEDVAYELTVDLPDYPKGELVQIPGLGTFENGDSYSVSKEEADAYRAYHTRQIPIEDKETSAIVGSKLVLGPTLLKASKSMVVGISVIVAKGAPPEPDPEPDEDPTPEDEEQNENPEGGE